MGFLNMEAGSKEELFLIGAEAEDEVIEKFVMSRAERLKRELKCYRMLAGQDMYSTRWLCSKVEDKDG